MAVLSVWWSLLVVLALAAVHLTIGHWRFLHGDRPSRWLGVSAGAALAYVFVYLLPKLAATQAKLEALLDGHWIHLLRNETYLLALSGLVTYLWLASLNDRLDDGGSRPDARLPRSRLLLYLSGWGLYSLLIGLLIAELPRPDPVSLLLTTLVLGLHFTGIDAGIRQASPQTYDRTLRWVFIAAILLGWVIGASTSAFRVTFLLLSAFVGGGTIITAIREELSHANHGGLLPFFIGVVVTSGAIVLAQTLQHPIAP